MKVHAYKVDEIDGRPLIEVLDIIRQEQDLRARLRHAGTVEMRVEHIEQRNGLWLMDFVKIRTDHGPGKVGRGSQIEGIPFNDDEGFGEETGMLFDPGSGYALIQYNHYGVRHGSIGEYLRNYDQSDNNVYDLKPKYDQDVERRLLQKEITKKVVFTIDISQLNAGDRANGMALSEAINIGTRTNSNKITLELSAGQGKIRGLNEEGKSLFQNVLRLFRTNPDAVPKLEFHGKDDKDAMTELLDLIGQRLCVEFNDLVSGPDLRYPRDQRWNCLLRARNGWQQLLNP